MSEPTLTTPTLSATDYVSRGDGRHAHGEFAAAAQDYNQALRLAPHDAAVCLKLAEALEASGAIDVAIKTYEHWLKILHATKKPTRTISASAAEKINRLFNAARAEQQKGNLAAAISGYQSILEMHADTPSALVLLGIALRDIGRGAEAEPYLLRALPLMDNASQSLGALHLYYLGEQRYTMAIAAAKCYLTLKPQDAASGWITLGKAYFFLNRLHEAIIAYEQASAHKPDHIDLLTELLRLHTYLCHWESAEKLRRNIVESITYGECADPCIMVSFPDDTHLTNAARWSQKHFSRAVGYQPDAPLPADARADGKLRIGYLSSDYCNHATATLISEMFELHDRSRFEIYAYSHGENDNSAERARIMQAVDYFRDIAASNDSDAATQVKNDGIDILVDLKGYTLGHRLSLMAARPAPLQMHYLGYPGSTGFSAIDYFIADAYSAPEGCEREFSEKLIRLPNSYQINDRKRVIPTGALPRSVYGLPENALVFAAFNNPYKITAEMFASWMRILAATPDSILWVYESHPHIGNVLRAAAEKHNVRQNRIIMAKSIAPNQHLLRYWHVDIALDTAPVGGHTTTSDALWCGVPVVALQGKYFAGRVAPSLLQVAGVPDLAVPTLAEYESLAIALANDAARRNTIKQQLTKNRMQCPLFDSAATTRAIEAAYLKAAELHRQGKKPENFSI